MILSRDVLGQKSLFRDNYSSPCPGTKGQRDRQNFFVPGQRDNGTGKFFCPGTKGQQDVPRDVPSLGNPNIKQGRRLFGLDIHSGAQLVKYEFEIF